MVPVGNLNEDTTMTSFLIALACYLSVVLVRKGRVARKKRRLLKLMAAYEARLAKEIAEAELLLKALEAEQQGRYLNSPKP
jgi:hypothetical protein